MYGRNFPAALVCMQLASFRWGVGGRGREGGGAAGLTSHPGLLDGDTLGRLGNE